MKTKQIIANSLEEIHESFNWIAKELEWILSICCNENPLPGTPLGKEIAQKFMSLFKDFNHICFKVENIKREILLDPHLNDEVKQKFLSTINLFYQRMNGGLFAKFKSVATTGHLPSSEKYE